MGKRIALLLIALFAVQVIGMPFVHAYSSDGPMEQLDLAKRDLDENRPESTIKILNEILRLGTINNPPVLSVLYLYLGRAYARLGRFKEAEKALLTGVQSAHGESEIIPGTKHGLSMNKAILLKDLLKLYLTLDRSEDALNVIETIKEEDSSYPYPGFTETEQLLKQKLDFAVSPSTDDYLESVFDAKLTMPPHGHNFKVWISGESPLANPAAVKVSPEYLTAIKQSFNDWSQAAKSAVLFKFVKDKKDADIEVHLSPGAFDPPGIDTMDEGSTVLTYNALGQISHAVISVPATLDRLSMSIQVLNTGSMRALEEVRWNCLHQIGHALGISKHSCNATDVMYLCRPDGVQNPLPSKRDGNTIKKAYSSSIQQIASLGWKRLMLCLQQSVLLIVPAILLIIFRHQITSAFANMGSFSASTETGSRRQPWGSLKMEFTAPEVIRCLLSFLVSLGAWTLMLGNNFSMAVAVMLVLLLHEVGHYIAAHHFKAQAELPVFLIAVAFVRAEDLDNPRDEFFMAAAGPLLGALAAGLLFLIAGRSPELMYAASFGFALNLLQLTPVPPFDGGYMAKAIDSRLWIVGILLVVCFALAALMRGEWMTFFGLVFIANSALGSIEHELGGATVPSDLSVNEKITFAIAYLAFAAILGTISYNLSGISTWF